MGQEKTSIFEVSNAPKCIRCWAALSVIVFVSMLILYFANQNAYVWFASKAKLSESIQAFFYLASGIIFIYLAFQRPFSHEKSYLLLFPLLLGFFYLMVFGEETSWMQDYFHYHTPSFLGTNLEDEANFHNLPLFDSADSVISQDRALHAFVLLYGILMPIGYRFWSGMRRLFNRLYLPVIPLGVMPVFIAGFLYMIIMRRVSGHWSHAEIKELFFTSGFFMAALSALFGKNRIA